MPHRSRSVRKIIVALTALLLLTNCGKKPEAQSACGFVQNQDGQRVSWKTQGLVRLYYEKSVPQDIVTELKEAIYTWEASIGRRVFDLQGPIDMSGGPKQDGYSVVYWMSDWDQNRVTLEQARTDIYWVGNQLTEADLALNARGFSIRSLPGPNDVDARSLILHELGHALGLAHMDAQASVMAKSLPSGFYRRDLKSADVNSVKCEY